MDRKVWLKSRQYSPEHLSLALKVLDEVRRGGEVTEVVRRNPLPGGGYLAKHILVAAYHQMTETGKWGADLALLARIRMKPIRTLSGVTTVTVLTKPYPCPGKCVFCPTDERMPKSYVPDEPGAKRALENAFDPFDQVSTRIQALEAIGHPVDKVELLILGGTWSVYPRDYQEWFIKRCFEAINNCISDTLFEGFSINETASHRNVGLVIETRPDKVTKEELTWLRRLGVTKVQLGVQSLDDRILVINQRGHTVDQTRQAVGLLRAAGFKYVVHWMPNLLGSTLELDRQDFARLWQDICPDEIKIYPNQLLQETELYQYWQRGEYEPYSTEELVNLLADIKPSIPRYCRVNRVVRDIPSTYVVAGNKRSSLRQDVHRELEHRGTACSCIRCREVGRRPVKFSDLRLDNLVYQTNTSHEHFLSFISQKNKLAGFLRLSLPTSASPDTGMQDLFHAAIIREVHIYGQSLQVGVDQAGAAQHGGLGLRLLQQAEKIARENGYSNLAVIAAVGTRQYYLQRGFQRGEYYLVKDLT